MGSYQLIHGSDQIVRVFFEGDIGETAARAYHDEIMGIFAEVSTPVAALLYAHKVNSVASAARRIFRDIGLHPMSGPTAVLGTNRYLRVAATFVIRAVGKNDIRIMDDEEAATAWLREYVAARVHSMEQT